MFYVMDFLCAFLAMLQNWQGKVSARHVALFDNLSTVIEGHEKCLFHPKLKGKITWYLRSLESEFKRYFPEFDEEEGKW